MIETIHGGGHNKQYSHSIGILTFWYVPNYGAFAQAYALNKVIRKMTDEKVGVYHIGWLHPCHRKLYFERRKPQCDSVRRAISPWFYYDIIKYIFNKKVRYEAFEEDWNIIPHVDVHTESDLENIEWDTIITGSDAIWEYSVKDFGDDIHLIGNNLKCNKLYSYAASFGDMGADDNFYSFISEGLKKYDEISVRDMTSKQIVNKLTGRKAEIVIDPTLLYDFKNDKNIPKSKYENYILVYGHNFTPEIIADVKSYADKNNLCIIGAGLAPEWCDIKLPQIGPLEWIGMFKEAEFTVTCTFHGLMFSINYNKKVLFNQVEYVANRSAWLVDQLGLEDLFKNVTLDKVLGYKWDYDMINEKLESLREDSIKFLQRALANE